MVDADSPRSYERTPLILTVDADSPTGEYGRYWHRPLIHLRENTVDIDG